MKTLKRNLRRHHRERVREKALRLVRLCWGYTPHQGHNREYEMDSWARKFAESLPTCSCWMCGNARRRDGIPVQEKRLEETQHVPPTYHGVGKKRHYRPSWKPYGEISKRKVMGAKNNGPSLEDLYREVLGAAP